MLQNVSKRTRGASIFGAGGGKTNFSSQGTSAAATMLQTWAKNGYFTDGYAGLGYDPSWQAFGKGKGVFLISGSWLTADLKKALGKNVGFFLLPPPKGKRARDARRRGPAVGDQLEVRQRRRGGDVPRLHHEQRVDAGRRRTTASSPRRRRR